MAQEWQYLKENARHLVRNTDLTKHKGCLKHGTDHKAYKSMKTNHKNLQKQHGYKSHYLLKNIINI